MALINLPGNTPTMQPGMSGTGNARMDPKAFQVTPSAPLAAGVGGMGDMTALMQALQKAKTKDLLAGRLPGTNPQSLGAGTGMSDAASATTPPPVSIGGVPSGPALA